MFPKQRTVQWCKVWYIVSPPPPFFFIVPLFLHSAPPVFFLPVFKSTPTKTMRQNLL